MYSEGNPFKEDIERQKSRPRRSWFWYNFVPCFCTIFTGLIGLIFLVYFVANFDPAGFKNPYNVDRPVRRSPPRWDPQDPYVVYRPERLRPSTVVPISTATPTTTPETDYMAGATNGTSNVTGQSVQESWITTDKPNGSTSGPLVSIFKPEIPPAELCIPAKMEQEEFLEKQWYCYRCWQDFKGTENFTLSEQAHRHLCHSKCYENEVFQECAIHLSKTEDYVPLVSARHCFYCKLDESEIRLQAAA